MIDITAINERRQKWMAGTTNNFPMPPGAIAVDQFLELAKTLPRGAFVTICDMYAGCYIHTTHPELRRRLVDQTGYDFDEFTIDAAYNGDGSTVRVVHENDIHHVIRYDDIAYQILLLGGFQFQPFLDRFVCTYRIKSKSGEVLHVVRESFLVDVDRTPADRRLWKMIRVDSWQVLTNRSDTYVRTDFKAGQDMAERRRIFCSFYLKNLETFGIELAERAGKTEGDFRLSYRHLAVLAKMERTRETQDIAQRLGISSDGVDKRLQKLREALRLIQTKHGDEEDLGTPSKVVRVAKRYGLWPIPQEFIDKGVARLKVSDRD